MSAPTKTLMLVVDPDGTVAGIYCDELADLLDEGNAAIRRASTVEPGPGGWYAEIFDGPTLGPYRLRQEALDAEVRWLLNHALGV